MTVLRPMGGRGKKEKYETKIIRVPLPLVPVIDWLCDGFYRRYYDGLINDDMSLDDIVKQLDLVIADRSEVVTTAKQVVAHKKSARVTVTNLLRVLLADQDFNL